MQPTARLRCGSSTLPRLKCYELGTRSNDKLVEDVENARDDAGDIKSQKNSNFQIRPARAGAFSVTTKEDLNGLVLTPDFQPPFCSSEKLPSEGLPRNYSHSILNVVEGRA